MKKAVKKPIIKVIKASDEEVKKDKPVIVTIKASEKTFIEPIAEKRIVQPFSKMEVLTKVPLPAGNIRVEVLKDFNGMIDILRAGDIIDLPERRYKSLVFRGMVKEYKGDKSPNKQR
jgi:hypothetical protein